MDIPKEKIFSFIVTNLYTARNLKWMDSIDDNDISAFIIQRALVANPYIRGQVRWLDKYVFALQSNPKMYLSLAWSVLPKTQRAPFFPYIKMREEDKEFDFLFDKIKKQFKLGGNDFSALKGRLLEAIKKDKVSWFSYYGVEKGRWKKHLINYDKIKEFGEKPKPKMAGLDKWGLA